MFEIWNTIIIIANIIRIANDENDAFERNWKMKIAITAGGSGWDSPVDTRFGRAHTFCIITLHGAKQKIESIPNTKNMHAAQGAGIQAAETVSMAGVETLLTGHVGPKAFRALNAARIDVYCGVQGNVRQALDDFLSDKLAQASGADVEGHW